MTILHDLRMLAVCGLTSATALGASVAHAQNTDVALPTWVVQTAAYTHHYSNNPEHKSVRLIGVERYGDERTAFWGGDQSLWGLSYFTNSFGQPTGYGYYGGVTNNLFGAPKWYFKWTAGVIYGYKPPYQDKVPFNHNGWSPGLVFGLGYKITPRVSAQVNALGNAGAMLTFSYQDRD